MPGTVLRLMLWHVPFIDAGTALAVRAGCAVAKL